MKRYLILGTGISGIGAAHVLLARGDAVVISDVRDLQDANEAQTLSAAGAEFIIGPQTEALLNGIDVVIPAPVISAENPVLAAARARNIRICPEIELAYEIAKMPIYAVTGTNGKTTTTTLLRDMLAAGGIKTEAAGNIGRSLSETCFRLPKEAIVAAEISSFQLEMAEIFHPAAAVILNITPDHLERHHTMEAYVAAKAKIFENMAKDSYLLLNCDDPYCRKLAETAPCKVAWLSTTKEVSEGAFLSGRHLRIRIEEKETDLCDMDFLPIPGMHNVQNVLAAAFLATLAGVSADCIREAIAAYRPLSHRIEFIREVAGVSYYDDSKATNTDSVEKALSAFTRPVTLICGGYDKGTPLEDFMHFVRSHAKHVVLMGAAAKRFAEAAAQAGITEAVVAKNMEDAVRKAASLSKEGEIVLLSPACSSFDSYKSYGERGDDFRKRVSAL